MKNNPISPLSAANSRPWEVSQASFGNLQDGEKIGLILEEAREHHFFLTPVTDDGRLLAQSLLISRTSGVLQVDKPLDWDDKITSFRLFFRVSNGLWFSFQIRDFVVHPFTLSFPQPGELCFLQRRQSPRIAVPHGTRAMLRKNGKFMSALFVRDVSTAGMLICTGTQSFGIEPEAELRDIVISIPEHGGNPGKTLPPIDNGQVVRSFFEEESNAYCHGISFRYESAYIRNALLGLTPGTV